MHILDKIYHYKKKEVAQRKKQTSIEELKQKIFFSRTCYSIEAALKNSSSKIIAEFKRKSPSKANINLDAKVYEVVPAYEKAGAAGISVLTDEHFFGGSLEFLFEARNAVNVPLLQKDFIVDPYQIYEAKAYGADFILLIAAILSMQEIQQFSTLAQELGLEVLVEVHDEEELQKVFFTSINLIGVNNRNLKTFEVDIAKSKELMHQIPSEFVKITESGIDSVESFHFLKEAGFEGFLMGEKFMREQEPGQALENFIQQVS